MQIKIKEFSKEEGIVPGQIIGALSEFGIETDQESFEADKDTLELLKESLSELKRSKEVPVTPNVTPRDVAQLLGVPQPEVQKTLMLKLKVMATLTTSLKSDVIESLFNQYLVS